MAQTILLMCNWKGSVLSRMTPRLLNLVVGCGGGSVDGEGKVRCFGENQINFLAV